MDDHHPAIEAEGQVLLDLVECMDILEEWTNVFRQRKPNVERLIGKRKRDDDIVRVQNDDEINDQLCVQHATVLQRLSSQLKSSGSTKLPALMYFYTEFLACCMSEVSAHSPLPSVVSVVAEFLRVWNTTNTTTATAAEVAWFHHIPQAEIWLQLLQVLVQGFVSCQEGVFEAVVQSQWLQTIDQLVIHLFSVLAAPPHQSSTSVKAETTFLDGCLPSAKLAASLHLHVLTLLHAVLSPTQTRRTAVVDVGHYVSLWRQSRKWLPTITNAMLVLAEDDEALIALLLALVQCVPLMTPVAAIDDSDCQTLLNDCCAALWTFVNDILLWDETLLIDFFSSEETAALELWIRCLKVLRWSDVQRRWAVHATAASAAVGTATLYSSETANTASVVSTALRVTILVDEPPAGDVTAAADGVTGLPPTLPSLPPLQWIPLNDGRTPAIADDDDDGESDATGVDDLYATLGIVVSSSADEEYDSDVEDNDKEEENGDGDEDGDQDEVGDDSATPMVTFLRRLQATLVKRHRLGLVPFHPRSLSRAIDVFLAS